MRQASGQIEVRAERQGLHPIDARVAEWTAGQRFRTGLLTLFCRHTSASLLIQENAAPAARRVLEAYFARLAPESATYEHDDEGPDDMPAHLRSALTNSQLSIPVRLGAPVLGTWQGIYLFEHRSDPPERRIAIHLIGQ
jgi:secondary thiamine-phosphate synthase enzyme